MQINESEKSITLNSDEVQALGLFLGNIPVIGLMELLEKSQAEGGAGLPPKVVASLIKSAQPVSAKIREVQADWIK